MGIERKMHDEIMELYCKHKNLFEAHKKLLALEKIYRNRSGKDTEIIINKIYKIVDEVSDDN